MRYIKNLIANGIPFGLFIFGLLSPAPWALTTALVLYWGVIVFSGILTLIPMSLFFEKKMNIAQLQNTVDLVSKAFSRPYNYFNIIQDLLVVGVFAYFGFNILAIFYVLHIFGYQIVYHNIKTYILNTFSTDAWEQVTVRLTTALDNGETEFSFFELLGKEHPQDGSENPTWWKK